MNRDLVLYVIGGIIIVILIILIIVQHRNAKQQLLQLPHMPEMFGLIQTSGVRNREIYNNSDFQNLDVDTNLSNASISYDGLSADELRRTAVTAIYSDYDNGVPLKQRNISVNNCLQWNHDQTKC